MNRLIMLKKQTIRLLLLTLLVAGTGSCAKKQIATTTSPSNDAETTAATDSKAAGYGAYAGSYQTQLQEVGTAEVTVENNRLYGQSAGSPKTELIPEGKDTFRVDGMNATVTFTRDSGQKVTGLVITVDGNEIRGEKVK